MKREKFKINILWAEFASDDPNNSSPLLFHAVKTLILKLWYLHQDEHLVPLCNQDCMSELCHKPKHTPLSKHSQGICCVNSPQLSLKHCRQMPQILTKTLQERLTTTSFYHCCSAISIPISLTFFPHVEFKSSYDAVKLIVPSQGGAIGYPLRKSNPISPSLLCLRRLPVKSPWRL